MTYENDIGLKGEILKANALIKIEDQLISDVSSLEFFYNANLQMASWIDAQKFNFILSIFNELDSEIVVLPEHSLISEKENALYVNQNTFIASFSDGSGFGGSSLVLPDYLLTLDLNERPFNNFRIFTDSPAPNLNNFSQSQFEEKGLTDLHYDFLNDKKRINENLFERKISIKFLKSKFRLNQFEALALSASIAIILITPFIINSLLHSSISSYKQNTVDIFKQLNPSFTRLINPKAQINDLTREIPMQQVTSSKDLEALSFIEQLADKSIEKISVDINLGSVTATVRNLPQYKLTLFQELIKVNSAKLNADALRQGPDGLFGDLVIYYDAE
tara:strand:- start:2529 stop:3527 length:999 start_codon:yes stop_codon:yes gene_type:complete